MHFRRERALGVLVPVRLQGPQTASTSGAKERTSSAPEPARIIDCRVVLSLFDSTEILKRHRVVEVRHFSMYRLPPPSWPRSKPATRHLGGLAIDAGRFLLADGSALDVDRDFHGAIDAKTCGREPPRARHAHRAEPAPLAVRPGGCAPIHRRAHPNYDPPHRTTFTLSSPRASAGC